MLCAWVVCVELLLLTAVSSSPAGPRKIFRSRSINPNNVLSDCVQGAGLMGPEPYNLVDPSSTKPPCPVWVDERGRCWFGDTVLTRDQCIGWSESMDEEWYNSRPRGNSKDRVAPLRQRPPVSYTTNRGHPLEHLFGFPPGSQSGPFRPGNSNNPFPPGHSNDLASPGHFNDPSPPGYFNHPSPPGHFNYPSPPGYFSYPSPPGHFNYPSPPGHYRNGYPPGHK